MPARGARGVRVESVRPRSPAQRAGIEEGDVLVSLDGQPIGDFLDYMFCSPEGEAGAVISRGGRRMEVLLQVGPGEDPGLTLEHFKVRTCRNKCVFCFVSQLPRGLRRTLYVKDEDYRMSFLYGNYVTLSNLTSGDRERIVAQRLSPLYISVHSTDKALRDRMLGNPGGPDIMTELRFFKEHGIRMHTQIVLCPGYNDGPALRRTVRDLYSLYPYVMSVAVVPVGLTAHRRVPMRPVGPVDAGDALDMIEGFQRRFLRKHGDPLLYGADELFIKAGRRFPPLGRYGELHQIENGVGMVPLFLDGARRAELPAEGEAPALRYLTFTGVSFHPYLSRFLARLRKAGVDVKAVPVENVFFGESVTVAGLLTGRDIVRALAGEARGRDVLLVPDVVLREGQDVMLDDLGVADMRKALGIRTRVIESTPDGLIKGVMEG